MFRQIDIKDILECSGNEKTVQVEMIVKKEVDVLNRDDSMFY